MFFELIPELKEIAMAEVSAEHLTAGYLSADALPEIVNAFGFHEGAISECLNLRDNYRSSIDIYAAYTFGIVNLVDARNVFLNSDRIAFFFQKNLFLFVTLRDEDGSTNDIFAQSLKRFKPEGLTLEKLIYGLLENTISRDAQALSEMEFDISELEGKVTLGHIDRAFHTEIYERKRRLLTLQNYYDQLIELGEGLQENENEIFEEETLHYFALFTAKAERLSSTVERLCASLNELRAAHQAALDYNLNNVMKLLSVITTIFLPLTLIVGWYGMNFNHMPELQWRYGYLFVIALTLGIIAVSLLFFKRKRFF